MSTPTAPHPATPLSRMHWIGGTAAAITPALIVAAAWAAHTHDGACAVALLGAAMVTTAVGGYAAMECRIRAAVERALHGIHAEAVAGASLRDLNDRIATGPPTALRPRNGMRTDN